MNRNHRASNYSNFLLVTCCALWLCATSRADTIKDKLDQAKSEYASSMEAVQHDLTVAFDEQIKATSEAGNLDAVEQLRTQRKAFASSQTVPTGSDMRGAVAKYQKLISTADANLKAAYESALSEYTKAGHFDDATAIKRTISERFGPAPDENARGQSTTGPTAAVGLGDPIFDALETAKQEFRLTVSTAHEDVLAAIDGKAKAATAKGDLDGYKAFSDLADRVRAGILVPDDVKDTAIRGANAKFARISESAHRKLSAAYQTAIREYTKVSRIEEAEAIKAELQDGGWFASFTGHPVTIDLLKAVDLTRDTLRKGWRFNNGVLEPTAWDQEHGPALRIPVSAKGSYVLDFRFTLQHNTPGPGSLYLHLPVGGKWGFMELTSGGQMWCFDLTREPQGRLQLPLGKANEGSVRVTLLGNGNCRVSLALNGEQSFSWEGTSDEFTFKSDAPVFSLEDNSCFGIQTQTARIMQMRLSANSDTIGSKRSP